MVPVLRSVCASVLAERSPPAAPRLKPGAETDSPRFDSGAALLLLLLLLRDQMTPTYKGYLIKENQLAATWLISKEGFHISYACSLDHAKQIVDGLT